MTVYIYNGSGTIATFPFKQFFSAGIVPPKKLTDMEKLFTLLLAMYFGLLNVDILKSQDLISESLCYVIGKVNSDYDKIIVISESKLSENCNVLIAQIEYSNNSELIRKLTKHKLPLLESRILKIENSECEIIMTWYNVYKKGKRVIKNIEGSITLKYCFDCDAKKFVLCNEISNFH